ncbi:MAG: hypothetical protein GY795_17995 [Desulfobacterales bacterium]|nr:hypothetical protein [Desulfobacterales bacterium]
MKTISVLIIMFCLSAHTPALAEEKWTIEKLYSYHETHFPPKKVLHMAQERALYAAKQCEKGEKECNNVIEEFSKQTDWNRVDARYLQFTISATALI